MVNMANGYMLYDLCCDYNSSKNKTDYEKNCDENIALQ